MILYLLASRGRNPQQSTTPYSTLAIETKSTLLTDCHW